MNNKGFAVSTILYGLLILSSAILFLLVGTMAFTKKQDSDFVDQIETELNECIWEGTC